MLSKKTLFLSQGLFSSIRMFLSHQSLAPDEEIMQQQMCLGKPSVLNSFSSLFQGREFIFTFLAE